MIINHLNQPTVGSAGRIIAVRVQFGPKEKVWYRRLFDECSDLLGEVAPIERDDILLCNDRWLSGENIRGFVILIYEESDFKLIEPVLHQMK